MSRGSYTNCDKCGYEEKVADNNTGGIRKEWIVVNRAQGGSHAAVPTGVHYFCSDICYIAWSVGVREKSLQALEEEQTLLFGDLRNLTEKCMDASQCGISVGTVVLDTEIFAMLTDIDRYRKALGMEVVGRPPLSIHWSRTEGDSLIHDPAKNSVCEVPVEEEYKPPRNP